MSMVRWQELPLDRQKKWHSWYLRTTDVSGVGGEMTARVLGWAHGKARGIVRVMGLGWFSCLQVDWVEPFPVG